MHLTIGSVIRMLLPDGVVPGANKKVWDRCPFWAPDVFALAATIAELSSCYAEPGLALSRNMIERKAKIARAERAEIEGAAWSSKLGVPAYVEGLWSKLIKAWDEPLCKGAGEGLVWKQVALELLAIADEACSSMGYIPDAANRMASAAFDEFLAPKRGRTPAIWLPNSLAAMVPPDIACVLPKAMTPEVGCTLRSLSHNLALLPGIGVVKAEWYIGSVNINPAKITTSDRNEEIDINAQNDHALNLLLIPFPYVVNASDFFQSRARTNDADGSFQIRQAWLNRGSRKLSVRELAKFVGQLIDSAERDVGVVHGIVFPEAALDRRLGLGLAKQLAKDRPSIELLICGALTSEPDDRRNEALLFRLSGGEVLSYVQSKHHRWRVDSRQIRQYQLGSALDPNSSWWEHIDLHDRRLQFGLNRHEAVVAALVCEDLARQDPVLPVIRSIGPSLVVALLMDGPQLASRWSARYATVLAEDPGSSVLTLTSLGLINRSLPPGEIVRRVVGLWKDRDGPAIELVLPECHHGLLLSLSRHAATQRTLDLRSDGGSVVEYRLSGIRSVKLDDSPAWLDRTV